MGTAGSFVILAGSGITNTGPTTINGGDIGTFPTTSITGRSSMTITGTDHKGSAVTQQAKSDLVTAYNNAAGQGPRHSIPADLTGKTLLPGVYNSASSIHLTGTLTLNGAVTDIRCSVFQAGSTLITSSGEPSASYQRSQCLQRLLAGRQLGNAWYRLDVLGDDPCLHEHHRDQPRHGPRARLARNGAVTLDSDRILRPNCASSPGTPVTTTTVPTTRTTTRSHTTTTSATATTSHTGTTSRTGTTMPGTATTLTGTGSWIPSDVPPPAPGTPKHRFGFTG